MAHQRLLRLMVFFLVSLLVLSAAGCSCGDDDDDTDDDAGIPDDTGDDDNDDDADDDADDTTPDDTADDDTGDDSGDDDTGPVPTEGFVIAPGGSYMMGSSESEPGHRDNETQRQVELTHTFEIMAREVTQKQFKDLLSYNPSRFKPPHIWSRPVENVTWYDALSYANRLSAEWALESCYTLENIVCEDDQPDDAVGSCKDHGGIAAADVTVTGSDDGTVYGCAGFRLPTDAEWEYATRAGTTTAFFNGDLTHVACSPTDPALEQIAWYCANSDSLPHDVGTKAANPWGLYDTSGNVSEWTWDWYTAQPGGTTDPEGPADGDFRVTRGGSIRYDGAVRCRSAYRTGHTPGFRGWYLGFRLARTRFVEEEPMNFVPAAAPETRPAKAPKALPDGLPFAFTRTDVGTPLTEQEITDFTKKITGFWKDTNYFHWLLWVTHGMSETNPDGMPDYKLWWQDVAASKSGSTVTFTHVGGADNLTIGMGKVFNNVAAFYLLTGDAAAGRLVEQLSKGYVALINGFVYGENDPEPQLLPRTTFTQDNTYTEEGRDAIVQYDPAKHYSFDWNAHTIRNPINPYYGDIWIRNMRSKDDVPHIYRAVPMLQRLVEEAPDTSVHDAAAEALRYLQGFARDVTDSGYYIRTKEEPGDALVPLAEDGFLIVDLASFVMYDPVIPNAECDGRLGSALIAYGSPLDLDCGNGIGWLYETLATLDPPGHYYNWAIIRYLHVAALTTALIAEQDTTAYPLLEGMATRVDTMMAAPDRATNPEWDPDTAAFLLAAATGGLPLTSEEAQLVVYQYSRAVDWYETWPNWDPWDGSVPDGAFSWEPWSGGGWDKVVNHEEMLYLFEYCYAPFRNETSAPLVDCDVIADPEQWGV